MSFLHVLFAGFLVVVLFVHINAHVAVVCRENTYINYLSYDSFLQNKIISDSDINYKKYLYLKFYAASFVPLLKVLSMQITAEVDTVLQLCTYTYPENYLAITNQ